MKSVGQVMFYLNEQEQATLQTMTRTVPVTAVLVEKRGTCHYVPGDTFVFAKPEDTPVGLDCPGLLRALRPFVLAAAQNIPSAQQEGYFVSCPGRVGTIWRVEPNDAP